MDKQEMIKQLQNIHDQYCKALGQMTDPATNYCPWPAAKLPEFEQNVYALRKAVAFVERYYPVDEREQRWMDAKKDKAAKDLSWLDKPTGACTPSRETIEKWMSKKPTTWVFGPTPNELRSEPKKQNPFYPEEKS